MNKRLSAALLCWAALLASRPPASAQAAMDHMKHPMPMVDLGGGWMLIGMAQVFPAITGSLPKDEGTPLEHIGLYLTQPAAMFNLESPKSRLVLRTTLNFEGMTQPWGELNFGAWGEGFLDKRHPHTLLHEFMLSYNFPRGEKEGWSFTAGRGFAPYGTDDPMSRPVLKYPTNHHLSQILERWTLNAVFWTAGFSAEAGVYGGDEPDGPYDFSNFEGFGRSWAFRLSGRSGETVMGVSPWELYASFARTRETHGAFDAEIRSLMNAALRHEANHRPGRLYALVEASLSAPGRDDGYYSFLAEASLQRGAHQPYARIEFATRPEYERQGAGGNNGFFRYDHDAEPIGTTRWLIFTGGYGFKATKLPYSLRPFAEVEWQHVSAWRGISNPLALYGRSSFATLSTGFRVFLGGDPMRMGAYGVLDPMTMMHRMDMSMKTMTEHHH